MVAHAGAKPRGELLALKIRKQGRKMTSGASLETNRETRPLRRRKNTPGSKSRAARTTAKKNRSGVVKREKPAPRPN
jgi:hypothetical protein